MNRRSPILTAAEMLAAEEEAIADGVSVEELMERAGRAVADIAWRIAGRCETLILCGPGNNGGDGYVIARVLAERGSDVRVATLGDPKTDAAIAASEKWNGPTDPIVGAKPATLVIDALFGTGLKRPLGEKLAYQLMELVNSARHGVAVDLPSGIETDSGVTLSPIASYAVTVALGALKPAHRLQPAANTMGRIVVADIGIESDSDCVSIGRPALAKPRFDAHKYRRGYVFVAEGEMPGAASLAAQAAMRSGAGYVVMAGPERGNGPQAMIMKQAADPKTLAKLLTDDRIDAVVAGPGLGTSRKARARLEAVLNSGKKLVLDADALTLLADMGVERLRDLPETPVLTPHEGEFERLFGGSDGSKLDRARKAAERSGAVVVYKGSDTVVAEPRGRAAISEPLPSWLATAGTGDVLSGIIAGRCAKHIDPPSEAVCDAVWLHGDAARRAGPFLVADDIVAQLPAALASCLN